MIKNKETKEEIKAYMVVTSPELGLLIDAEVKKDMPYLEMVHQCKYYNELHKDDGCKMYYRIETVKTETEEWHF